MFIHNFSLSWPNSFGLLSCTPLTKESFCHLSSPLHKSIFNKSKKVILPICTAVVRDSLKAESSSGIPTPRERWTCRSKSSKGPQRWWRDWNIFHMKKSWDSWDCSAWRREGSGEILSIYMNTWLGQFSVRLIPIPH